MPHAVLCPVRDTHKAAATDAPVKRSAGIHNTQDDLQASKNGANLRQQRKQQQQPQQRVAISNTRGAADLLLLGLCILWNYTTSTCFYHVGTVDHRVCNCHTVH